ncbi:hydroxyphenylacetyl-CoA thioesterase PaaI [Tsukamurella spumae]|nr:hydroxyphenylacetyl-CoA thioesterase PaaI [Tsukamurella spumae]
MSAAVVGGDCEPARSMFAADNASRALGIEIVDLHPGVATTTVTVGETMVNGHGITHGGYVFLLADTTFALACNSRGDAAVAARADIRFLRATRLGDVLTATAVERERFGRNGLYDVTVRRGGEVIAEFRGDSRTIPSGG